MAQISRLLALACLTSCLGLATPALSRSTADKPKGDHPERHCKPEKHNCPVNNGGQDYNRVSSDSSDDLDDPFGDNPERNCKPEQEACPTAL